MLTSRESASPPVQRCGRGAPSSTSPCREQQPRRASDDATAKDLTTRRVLPRGAGAESPRHSSRRIQWRESRELRIRELRSAGVGQHRSDLISAQPFRSKLKCPQPLSVQGTFFIEDFHKCAATIDVDGPLRTVRAESHEGHASPGEEPIGPVRPEAGSHRAAKDEQASVSPWTNCPLTAKSRESTLRRWRMSRYPFGS